MNHKNAVLQGLENMKEYDNNGLGLQYSASGKNYSTDEMIMEIKNNTDIGKEFVQSVYDTVISYMGKFSQNTEE